MLKQSFYSNIVLFELKFSPWNKVENFDCYS